MTSGSTLDSCTLRTVSSAPKDAMPRVLAFPSTRARAVTISLTYSPAPYPRQRVRKALLVTPAMGASTTGTSTTRFPSLSTGVADPSATACVTMAPPTVR